MATQADELGVGDDVGGRGGRVAGDVQLGIDVALGEAAEDADEEVEDAGQAGEGAGGHPGGPSVWKRPGLIRVASLASDCDPTTQTKDLTKDRIQTPSSRYNPSERVGHNHFPALIRVHRADALPDRVDGKS